jgi:branched-chain amino acid transport system ATP-binding protein
LAEVIVLRVQDLEVKYGDFQALWGVSLEVREGEVVCLLGPNGAGKSTLISAVSGLVRPAAGKIEFCGERISGLPTHQIVTRGLSHVMEQRRLFPYLTVEKNLLLGSYQARARAHRDESLEWVFRLFPILRERRTQLAHSLSGGEQQMAAIARGLMSRPRFLMVDEPFLGLAPLIVRTILDIIKKVNEAGVTVLFIEQNVQLALGASHRGYLLESGRMVATGSAQQLLESDEVRKVYLGI